MRALGANVQEGLAQMAGGNVKQVVSEMGWSLQQGFAVGARLEKGIRRNLALLGGSGR